MVPIFVFVLRSLYGGLVLVALCRQFSIGYHWPLLRRKNSTQLSRLHFDLATSTLVLLYLLTRRLR